jgi:hypothetical protein
MFSLFIQNKRYFYNDVNENLIEKDICFICWLPAEKDNMIKRLSDFSHINCKCSPNIHQICLSDWMSKNNSCPICRKKTFNSKQKYLTLYYRIIKCNVFLIKIICYINLLYFIYIILNNLYFITFFDDYTDIY